MDILAHVQAAGITLRPAPDGKIIASPSDRLTDELREFIRRHRQDILLALGRQHRVHELAVELRLYADRNGFSEADFSEAMAVAVSGDLEGWIAYVAAENQTRH